MIYYLRQLNKFLKQNYGTAEYKPLRRNIWCSFIFMIFMGLYSWITAIFVFPFAILFRKRVQKDFIRAIKYNLIGKDVQDIRLYFLLISTERQYRIIETGVALRLGAAEKIKTYYDAKNHCEWLLKGNAWRYDKDDFTLQEQAIIAKIAFYFSFDKIRDILKKEMSFINYHLLLHLKINNISNPYPQKFMLDKYNGKWWLALWIDYVFRNPRNTGYQIGKRFSTCDLTDIKIKGMKYAYGKVEIEGIWERELGVQFYFTPDMKYFHYQCSDRAEINKDNLENSPIPVKMSNPQKDAKFYLYKDTNYFQFGYGYLKPTSSGDRPYLGTSLRQIKNQITYYKEAIDEKY